MPTNKMLWETIYGSRFKNILMQKPLLEKNLIDFVDSLRSLGLLKKITSFLSIGAGAGERELFLAHKLQIPFGYIDPTVELTKIFSQKLREAKLELLLQDEHFGPFETFKTQHRYDLIFALHSWYYIGANERALRNVLSLLTEKGHLYIVMIPSNTFTVTLSKQFGSHASDVNFLFSNGFSVWAKKKGYNHKYQEKEVEFNIQAFLEKKKFTSYGKAWIAYMLRQDWNTISVQKRKQIKDFFLDYQKNGMTRETIGSLIFCKGRR